MSFQLLIMEILIRDPITNVLNNKINKYQICDNTFNEEQFEILPKV